MDILTPQQLADIVKACRKAGVTTFKGYGIELVVPPAIKKPRKTKNPEPEMITVMGPDGPTKIPRPEVKIDEDEIPNDSPTAEQLLYWSTGDEAEI